ncbi:hypothetical protein [Lachnospira eligens]|jgi:hypothetical protein|uniref:hypothetical protein n=1 Tax=Lachnospira eligens TaxID=39485 RepID=UPI000E514C70|nr:hypothetical protein [Lachnospira eligens]RHK52948.1 hypothetical protein DW057_09350 [Lachnospira eligens]RHK83737.1 hypothetical protein DW044_12280 [Lachnospira eligens]
MYDIIKHYKVLVLGLAFILWATLLAAAVLNLYNKNKRKSYSKDIENAITTVYEDAEFIENGSDSGTFIHNGKECKYRVEDGKIKCYIYTDTDDVEVKSINLK